MTMRQVLTEQQDLFSGTPMFSDRAIADQALKRGITTAWHAGFAAKGVRLLDEVRGDFAVGMQLEDGKVFLAVDRFAIRSLCYRIDGDHLRFSERADDVAGADGEILQIWMISPREPRFLDSLPALQPAPCPTPLESAPHRRKALHR